MLARNSDSIYYIDLKMSHQLKFNRATTFGMRASDGELYLSKLADPEEFNRGPPSRVRPVSQGRPSNLWSGDPTMKFWRSVVAKSDPTSTVFLLGGSTGTLTLTENQGSWIYAPGPPANQETPRIRNASSSVDWFDMNVYMSGNLGGEISLIDTRVGQSALRFRHPAAIVRIKNLGAGKIMAVGLSNTVSVFA